MPGRPLERPRMAEKDEFVKAILDMVKDAGPPIPPPNIFLNTEGPGGIIEIYFEHPATGEYAEWINPYLTLLRAENDNRVIDCQVWFVRQIVDTAGACLDKAQEPKETTLA
jgi:hypothetical protein